MANIKAKVTPQQRFIVTNYAVNTATLRLGDAFDVNTDGASDGAVLVYNGSSSSWEATTELDNQNTIINGGGY